MVGLSATPGTDIRSIQSIITTLNINRIEAKMEDDPEVKQYIHHREEEVILVDQPDAVSVINQKFEKVIQPILQRLRDENVSSRLYQHTGTLKSFVVYQAQEEFHRRFNDHRLDGHFSALMKLTQIREQLETHGVLTVRTKLLTLKNDNNRGMMANVVKSPGFESLLRDVVKATHASQDDIGDEVQEDLMKNNPKYAKLLEVLKGQ